MVALLTILAILAALGGVLGGLTNMDNPQAAMTPFVSGVVSAAILAGFARVIYLLQVIAERTPEIPGLFKSTWVPMMTGSRVGSVSVSGGGYHAFFHRKGEDLVYLEKDGTRERFPTRFLAQQEAESFLRSQK